MIKLYFYCGSGSCVLLLEQQHENIHDFASVEI